MTSRRSDSVTRWMTTCRFDTLPVNDVLGGALFATLECELLDRCNFASPEGRRARTLEEFRDDVEAHGVTGVPERVREAFPDAEVTFGRFHAVMLRTRRSTPCAAGSRRAARS